MISGACIPPDVPGLVANLLADTDCQAFGLVERGYAALSAPGSATATTLTAMMVIAVALFGYQLMLGRGIVLSDLTGLAVRLGIVLLLAASWSTWQGVAYDTLARAPTRIAEDLISAIDAPAPLAGIQSALDKIEQASIGWRQRAGIASPLVGGPPTTAMTLNVAAFLLTMTTLGLLVVARIVLALLLAITPVVAGFLLFDATRGLLEGWIRAMIAAALVPLGVLVLAAVELAIVMPILDRILAQQAAGQYVEDSVVPLGLVTIIFALAVVSSLGALRSIARGVRLARNARPPSRTDLAVASAQAAYRDDRQQAERSDRARNQPSVVRALESAQRRESNIAAPTASAALVKVGGQRGAAAAMSPAVRQALPAPAGFEAAYRGVTPLRTQSRNRASRAAKRRDR